MFDFDILVVGCGPAGIAAACAASEADLRVGVVDANPAPGGQIWRGQSTKATDRLAGKWLRRLDSRRIQTLPGTQIVDRPAEHWLSAETDAGPIRIRFSKLILATGARERWIPFPGWTLPNVTGAGGLQALAQGGVPVAGSRIVVAGSGPLLLAVAAHLHEGGACIPLIAEQARSVQLARLGPALIREPRKLLQAWRLRMGLRRSRYLTDCWVIAANGQGAVESVTLRRGRRTWTEPCDFLACGFGLVPNVELAALLGCHVHHGSVSVDEWQESSLPGVFCAGETTGVGGVDLALVEGEIAGYAAADQRDAAMALFGARRRARRFATALHAAFALRDELRSLVQPDTVVCRCEDVRFERLTGYAEWRSAKLQTRCGMGPCQGRVCGPALEFLLGFHDESIRAPLFPAAVATLARNTERGN